MPINFDSASESDSENEMTWDGKYDENGKKHNCGTLTVDKLITWCTFEHGVLNGDFSTTDTTDDAVYIGNYVYGKLHNKLLIFTKDEKIIYVNVNNDVINSNIEIIDKLFVSTKLTLTELSNVDIPKYLQALFNAKN